MHLTDYSGPNIWAKLTLGELGCIKHFSYWVWLLGSNGIAAKAHTQLKNPGKPDSMIHYHISEEEMHLSVLIFFTVFLPRLVWFGFLGFFFLPGPTEKSGWGERQETLQTHLPTVCLWYTAGCLGEDRCLSVMWGLISVNQSLLFYTSCPFIEKSPEGS